MKNILKPTFVVLLAALAVAACDKKDEKPAEKHPVELISNGEPMEISIDGNPDLDVDMWIE